MGNPEDWDRLWTPHRLAYIRGEGKPDNDRQGDHCPFCRAPAGVDEDNLVVAKGNLVFAVLNKFPYNSGHLLICPYRHVPDYTDLHTAELAEFALFTQAGMVALRNVSVAQGFNIGMNQGSVSGAGISAHLHQHIVPRWGGDTNFMPVVGGTKVLPQLLEQTRELLAAAWPEV
ncbi:MAG: HIT domain-containing protein [Candidatus Nanopelagicales bacterium]|nr:HIT domain-containing protein [Candidatus Nanopelagicales bacterium]